MDRDGCGRTKEEDGKTHTWYEVDGVMIVHCTREEYGEYDFRGTSWTESGRGFWDFLGPVGPTP